MKKLKKCEAYQFFHNHSVQQEMCTILEPGIKGVVIENIDGSLSSCFGVLEEGYNQPLDRDGSVVATWGVFDDNTINHQLYKCVIDRTLRDFSFECDCNRSKSINFYHGKNSCNFVQDIPRKWSSSVLVFDYNHEEQEITLLPCVLKDTNKLSCKSLEFQQACDPECDFCKNSTKEVGKDSQHQFWRFNKLCILIGLGCNIRGFCIEIYLHIRCMMYDDDGHKFQQLVEPEISKLIHQSI